MDTLLQDLRHARRTLFNHPGFTASVILTLALGIGATTALFTICDAVLFKRLPYARPDELVMLWERNLRDGTLGSVAPANFVDWRGENRTLAGVAALNPFRDLILTGRGEAEQLAAAAVSAELFDVLGTKITIGRGFSATDDQPGQAPVVILSHGLWQRRFGSDPSIVGRPLVLNDTAHTIVGVLPRDFELVSRSADFQARNRFDVWVPLALNLQRLQRGTHPLRVFARLRSGVTPERAQADLDVVGRNIARAYPDTNKDQGVALVPLAEQITSDVRPTLLTLFAAVGLLLLIACVNVANLLLGRANARQREMAVRTALGASRLRLARQLLTESVVLAALGGVAGTAAAWLGTRALLLQLPVDLPRLQAIGVDSRALVFSGLTSVAIGLLIGCVPLARRAPARDSLKEGRSTASRAQTRASGALVAGQIGLACVLLIGAGLLGKSLWRLLDVAPGFHSERVLTAQISLGARDYADVARIGGFQRELLERVRSLPGVQAAGLAAYLPLSGTDNSWAFTIEGRPPRAPGDYMSAKYRPVSPGYFEALQIPLVRGRRFTDADREDASAVVLMNESAARAYWPNQDPIGQRIQIEGPPWRTVVGIVGDVRHQGLDAEARPELYYPYAQLPYPQRGMTLVVRTSGEPLALAPATRDVVRALDPRQPVHQVSTLDQIVGASVERPRFRARLLGAFALAALLLASIGIYGVVNYLVGQRRREFGVRAALGATTGDLVRLVLQRSAVLVVTGVALGVIGAALLGRLVSTLLFGVEPFDPSTFVSASLLLGTVALFASYLPARRAAAISPVEALRTD
jgi:putative ABC transport system permease protein